MLETPVRALSDSQHWEKKTLTFCAPAPPRPQIEVVKTRAQVESIPGKKLGSFKIASQIARKEGLRGFYIGGLMTAVHDGISSGIFFFGCEFSGRFCFPFRAEGLVWTDFASPRRLCLSTAVAR